MGTCHLDIVIEPTNQGEILFQIECTAEIEYELDGHQLHDWDIIDLKFDKTWSNEVVLRALRPLVDVQKVEEQLIDKLAASGEISSVTVADRAAYHAGVL